MLRTLEGTIARGILSVAPTALGRGWNLDTLAGWLAEAGPAAQARWRIEPDLGQALRQAQQGAGTVLVTGSFHTVGDVMHMLGMDP